MFDQLPPFDQHAEDSVVASILVAPAECLPVVSDLVQPADFFRESNRWTYEACLALSSFSSYACSGKMEGQLNMESPRAVVSSRGCGTTRSKLAMQAQPSTLPRFDSSYYTYLASREWGLVKRAVRSRSLGLCEHCGRAAATEVHHLTYERLFHEELSDLLDVCHDCHQYLGGRTDRNPAAICCTPEQAREWLALVQDDPDLIEGALRHLAEVEDAWAL